MKRITRNILLAALSTLPLGAQAQTDSLLWEQNLDEVVVKAKNGSRLDYRTENVDLIDRSQLFRAACCNLGESFTTNPSVDVNYTDAATGARQIKLLGLSGTYVQMMTEMMPNYRGAAIPFALGYVPGSWMQSIQVSKGAASVKHGYESITGQISIDYLHPDNEEQLNVNVYGDSNTRMEANVEGNLHITDQLSTELLLHYDDRLNCGDHNGDGFMDMPDMRQYNFSNRWKLRTSRYIMHSGISIVKEQRNGGQMEKPDHSLRYTTDIKTDRYEAYTKHALILNPDHDTNIAFMANGASHQQTASYGVWGHRYFHIDEKDLHVQTLFETKFNDSHALSTGLSAHYDYTNGCCSQNGEQPLFFTREGMEEFTPGAYAQYTYTLGEKLTAMAGLRWDHSSIYGGFVTPRVHVKYSPHDIFSIRLSAGKGYRTPMPIAENIYLMASGKRLIYNGTLVHSESNAFCLDPHPREYPVRYLPEQEEAWNYGLSTAWRLPVADKTLELNAEYYYTNFLHQSIVNIDGKEGPNTIVFENLNGKSYSHTLQVDATYPLFEGFTATGAFRLNDARTTYDGKLRHRPMTSLYKGLLTLSYKTPLELWQFDVTGQINGKGYLYDYVSTYPAYFQLQAQVTREFLNFSVYVGGENLTNYKMKNPIIGADNPWSASFDATQTWGPIEGAMVYAGIRLKI